jgi:general secretion pathway protein G
MPSRRSAVSSRGLTRFEVTAIIGSLALVAAGIGLFTSSASAGTEQETAETDARRIAAAADEWRQNHSGVGCPTVSRLIEDDKVEGAVRNDDPWGNRYRIDCDGSATRVRSAGRDGRLRTDDDVVVSRDN